MALVQKEQFYFLVPLAIEDRLSSNLRRRKYLKDKKLCSISPWWLWGSSEICCHWQWCSKPWQRRDSLPNNLTTDRQSLQGDQKVSVKSYHKIGKDSFHDIIEGFWHLLTIAKKLPKIGQKNVSTCSKLPKTAMNRQIWYHWQWALITMLRDTIV